jgi:fused signal recognition particle receptor
LFDRLKQAFSSVTSAVRERKLSEKELDELAFEFQLALIECDVAQGVAQELTDEVKKDLEELKFERSEDSAQVVRSALRKSLESIFAKAGTIDVMERVRKKKEAGSPFVILFLGINGVGKTTTIAKFARMLKKNNLTVISAAGDTHRPGAIEQLTEHANRLAIKVVSQRYGADPAAVGRDGLLYAKSHHIDAVLIDTAGRMQTNQNLMEEMAKIVRVVTPDLKLFVADSLTGNDAVSQAELFSKYTGFDGVILTKADADARGGAALSIVYSTGKPILYLGVGQEYDDLMPFSPESFLDSILKSD